MSKTLVFVPGRTEILGCSAHGISKINVSTGAFQELSELEASSICLSPDGRFTFVGRKGGVDSYDTAGWTLKSEINLPADEHRIVATDGKILMTGSDGAQMPLFFLAIDTEGRLLPLGKLHVFPGRVRCGVFDSTTRRLTLACWRYIQQLTIPDLLATANPNPQAGTSTHTLAAWPKLSLEVQQYCPDHDRPMSALAMAVANRWLISASEDGEVRIHSETGGEPLHRLYCDSSVTAMALAPDGLIFTGHPDGSINAWEAARQSPAVRALTPERIDSACSVGFDSSGERMLLKAWATDCVAVCDTVTWQTFLAEVPGVEGRIALFRPGHSEIAISTSRSIRFYEPHGQELRLRQEIVTHGIPMHASFDARGELMAVSYRYAGKPDESGAELFEISSGRPRSIPFLEARRDDEISVALSPDGKSMAVVSDASRTLEIGGTEQFQAWHQTLASDFQGGDAVTFHPTKPVLACSGPNHSIAIWELAGRKTQPALKGHMGSISSLAFSPDGKRLVSASVDHSVRIWDWQTGEELLVLPNRNYSALCAQFSPDGLLLANTDSAPSGWVRSAVPWSNRRDSPALDPAEKALFDRARLLRSAAEAVWAGRNSASSHKFQEAADYYQRAWEIRKRVLGPNDPRTLLVQQSLDDVTRLAREPDRTRAP